MHTCSEHQPQFLHLRPFTQLPCRRPHRSKQSSNSSPVDRGTQPSQDKAAQAPTRRHWLNGCMGVCVCFKGGSCAGQDSAGDPKEQCEKSLGDRQGLHMRAPSWQRARGTRSCACTRLRASLSSGQGSTLSLLFIIVMRLQ